MPPTAVYSITQLLCWYTCLQTESALIQIRMCTTQPCGKWPQLSQNWKQNKHANRACMLRLEGTDQGQTDIHKYKCVQKSREMTENNTTVSKTKTKQEHMFTCVFIWSKISEIPQRGKKESLSQTGAEIRAWGNMLPRDAAFSQKN